MGDMAGAYVARTCGAFAPGNWAQSWTPACEKDRGHDGVHLSPGPVHHFANGKPWHGPPYSWDNHPAAPQKPDCRNCHGAGCLHCEPGGNPAKPAPEADRG